MTNREAIKLLKTILRTVCLGNQKFIDAVKKAISALEKQEQDINKCCETCKYELLELDAYPCCDCIRAKDHYEPYTEGKA